jgi:hypothetical protein
VLFLIAHISPTLPKFARIIQIGIFQRTNSIQIDYFVSSFNKLLVLHLVSSKLAFSNAPLPSKAVILQHHPTNYLISEFKLQSLLSSRLAFSSAPIPSKVIILHHHPANFLLIAHLNSAIIKRLIQPAFHHHHLSPKPQKQLSSSFLSFAFTEAAIS